MRFALLAFMLGGCPWVGPGKYETRVQDADGDGVIGDRFGGEDCLDGNDGVLRCDGDGDGALSLAAGGDDCDDADATVHPGAVEVCDGIDQDCNQLVDDGASDRVPVFIDADGDGHGVVPDGVACFSSPPPVGLSFLDDDCDDGTDTVFPGADEFCDGVDRDCDGEGFDSNSIDASTLFADADLDGYGAGLSIGAGCPTEGASQTSDDCDDTASTIYPGAPEIAYDGIDQACDGAGNEWDVDGDGFEERAPDNDCDDTNPNIFPGAAETCDGVDTDCDNLPDSADPNIDLAEKTAVFVDADADGFGDQAGASYFCPAEVPAGALLIGEDCDDSDPAIHPDADEIHYELSGIDQDCDGGANEWDADGDGVENRGFPADCDDTNPGIFPAAIEACDGIDSDCDGLADEDDNSIDPALITRAYPDLDGDGFGDGAAGIDVCPVLIPVGWLLDGSDCDDTEAGISPLADEMCADGIDNDCDGTVDQNAIDGVTLYRDSDGDGRGTPAFPVNACVGQPGTSPFSDDCDDGNPAIYPGAPEVCGDGVAQDCSTPSNATDCDGDGEEDLSFGGTDCDDDDATVNTGGSEVCDAIDNDCDGLIDSADPSVDPGSLTDFYDDDDGDGAGGALSTTNTCSPPAGTVANSDDCDDTDGSVFPGAIESCNGLDDNCNGSTDEDPVSAPVTWFIDRDQDGAGDPNGAFAQGCFPPLDADYVLNSDDCNDFDMLVQTPTWFRDGDSDNFGVSSDILVQCGQPLGYAPASGDCDDTDANRNPAEVEVCDGSDNDCDGLVDGEDDGVAGESTWYQDLDNDTFGNTAVAVNACSPPAQFTATDGDCNDLDAGIRPGALEICDSVDNDCDGLLDGDDPGLATAPFWYPDSDNDGFGDTSAPVAACTQPPGHVGNAGDCDDTSAIISPLGLEVCGGADEDCDGLVDDADPDVTSVGQWFLDGDLDGFGDPNQGSAGCVEPMPIGSHVLNNLDCLDTVFSVNPTGTEMCNGIDDNCDGAVDNGALDTVDWFLDIDGDGYGDQGDTTPVQACSAPAGRADNNLDCEDALATVNPSSPIEFCNGLDDNCDGLVDDDQTGPVPVVDTLEWYLDDDVDGAYGEEEEACLSPGPAWVMGSFFVDDCDDGDPTIYPGAFELCDGLDNNCLGGVDEFEQVEQVAMGPHPGGAVMRFRDNDSDGFGNPFDGAWMCAANPALGFIVDNNDCADFDDTIAPNATEVCDFVDNDCDDDVDDADSSLDLGTATAFYVDLDNDGHGDELDMMPVLSCLAGPNRSASSDDCDDTASFISPTAPEVCDFIDNDCDTLVDDDDPDPFGKPFVFDDSDGDSYGDPATTGRFCVPPPGFTTRAEDCDPSEGLTFPGSAVVGTGGSFPTVASAEAACGQLFSIHFRPGTHTGIAVSVLANESVQVFGTDPGNPPTLRNPSGVPLFDNDGGDLDVSDVHLDLQVTGQTAGLGVLSVDGDTTLSNVTIQGNDAVSPANTGCAVDARGGGNLDWTGGGVSGCGTTALVAEDVYLDLHDVQFDDNGGQSPGRVSNIDVSGTGSVFSSGVRMRDGFSTLASFRVTDVYAQVDDLISVGSAPMSVSSSAAQTFFLNDARFYDGNAGAPCLETSGNIEAQLQHLAFGGCDTGYLVDSPGTFLNESTFASNTTPFHLTTAAGFNSFYANMMLDNTSPCGTSAGGNVPGADGENFSNDCPFNTPWAPSNTMGTVTLMGYHPAAPPEHWSLLLDPGDALVGGVQPGVSGGVDIVADFDSSGLPDSWEIWWYGTDGPRNADDGDLWDDALEYSNRTSPLSSNSDGDGMLDSSDLSCPMDPGC